MEKIPAPDYAALFNPSSIALIGASKHIEKWGAIILLNILLGGYPGRIYPVNPNEETIFGTQAYSRVSDIPDPVDLAIIAIPALQAKKSVLDCARKGIRVAIVITSDFSETGENGARLERELTEAAHSSGIRYVGPNTMGIFSAQSSLIALMPPVRPMKGGVSLFSQSGNIGAQMLSLGEKFCLGFNKYVSSGNEGDLRAEDYLAYFGEDPGTKVIMAYIEGLDDGRRFLETARKISPQKPIIVYKGGRTPAGARAAQSHSGAMAGAKEIYQAAFRQSGILWAPTTVEMLEWGAALSAFPLPNGNRVAILTRGGGWGVVTADACTAMGLEVPPLTGEIIASLDPLLPHYWSKGNPVDLAASLSMEAYLQSLEILISWKNVDALIALGGDTDPRPRILFEVKQTKPGFLPAKQIEGLETSLVADRELMYRRVGEMIQQYRKPILVVSAGLMGERGKVPEDFPFPIFRTPESATQAASALDQYARYRSHLQFL
ncbi:MAG: CoA-binding protein [Deltaproteobacteria bacterium]|nr:CoA-binding protein [Deltaproteobacteria bacterium]